MEMIVMGDRGGRGEGGKARGEELPRSSRGGEASFDRSVLGFVLEVRSLGQCSLISLWARIDAS